MHPRQDGLLFAKGIAQMGVGQKTKAPSHKRIRAQGCLLGPKVFSKEPLKVVCLRIDNTTAIAHVNCKGGTRPTCLTALALELWRWCLERDVVISAQHVPGKLNTITDTESRVLNDNSE